MLGVVKGGIMKKKQYGISTSPEMMAKRTYRAQFFSSENGNDNNPGSESCYEDSMTIMHMDGVMVLKTEKPSVMIAVSIYHSSFVLCSNPLKRGAVFSIL